MEVVGAVTSVMSCLCANGSMCESLTKKCKNLWRPTRNLRKLKTSMEELDAQNRGLKNKLDRIWMEEGMVPTESVTLWIRNADLMKREVKSLIDEIEYLGEQPRACQFCSRIKLGESIEKKIQNTNDLREKGQFAGDSIAEALPVRGYVLSAPQVAVDATNMYSLERIELLLSDVRVRRIGVYGMGGVGKTTIMTEINNRMLKESNHFDNVIWVTVSKEYTLQKLQEDIARILRLQLSTSDSETVRASKLLEALNRRKRFVLILDDLWKPFPLESIGIPIPTVENGCKLVVVTRLLAICRSMESDEDVEIKVLSEDKAWSLFRAKVGDAVLTSPEIQSIALDVLRECGGLPLAIVTVGRSLRNATDISEWESTLAELRVSSANIDRMDESVFSRLKLSFERLKDDICRSCFLYCALYPQGHLIDADELIEYWMWEGLFGEVYKISQSKLRGRSILNELKYACMLESSTENGVECVKMHDLMRDMAIRIMSGTHHRCIVYAGIRLRAVTKNWPKDAQRVSLMRNDLKLVDICPNCPQLRSLLLQYNSLGKDVIKEHFFYGTGGLKVLDLSYTGIASLPMSLTSLHNLGALLLSYCWNLREIPSMAELTKLMVLDLSFASRISRLPHGMEQLCILRRLDIRGTGIAFFPSGLLSKLTNLEELLTIDSGVLWASNKSKDEMDGACIEELISVSTLSVLEVNFLEFDVFDLYVKSEHWRQLSKYKFFVGKIRVQSSNSSQVVCLEGCLSISSIPANTTELHLKDCSSLKRLNTCAPLKTCYIECCGSMECIVASEISDLSMLERMDMHSLCCLEMICGKTVRPGTLMNLKIITVVDCHKLKMLFTTQLLLEMKNLEEIEIYDCANMEYIIEGEDETKDNEGNSSMNRANFPRLKCLQLERMPELKGVSNGIVECDSLRSLEVQGCDNLKRLPVGLFGIGTNQQFSSTPALKHIKGKKQWWESLEWDQPHALSLLQPFFMELSQNLRVDSDREDIAGPSASSSVV